MKLLRELNNSAKNARYLKSGYRWITSAIGLLGVTAGCGIFLSLGKGYASVLNLDWEQCATCSSSGIVWVALFVVTIPLAVFLGCFLVAGTFSLFMYKMGRFSKQQAIEYALYSKYPEHWFKDRGA